MVDGQPRRVGPPSLTALRSTAPEPAESVSEGSKSPGFSDPAAHSDAADDHARSAVRRGLAYGFAAYGTWGILAPLYFRQLSHVPPLEILAHRVVWSVIMVAVLLTWLRRWGQVRAVARRRTAWFALTASATLVALNWLVFIHAVVTEQIKEASLGYFLNPLVSIALGVVFLGERMTAKQWACVAIAAVGVGVRTIATGALPWIALTLAITFGFYGLIRKRTNAGPIVGLAFETWILAPLAVVYLAVLGGGGSFGDDASTSVLLVLAGPMTALPLLWFAAAAGLLRLSTIGMLQYLAPSLQFLIAVLALGEPFTGADAVSFGLIWLGIVLFVAESAKQARRAARGRH